MLKAVTIGIVAAAFSTSAALAGEITGKDKPTPLKGASICMFSGLNDDPEGLDPANGPGGKSQSYGQNVKLGLADPENDKFEHPGFLCNPNNLPMKDIGGPNS